MHWLAKKTTKQEKKDKWEKSYVSTSDNRKKWKSVQEKYTEPRKRIAVMTWWLAGAKTITKQEKKEK